MRYPLYSQVALLLIGLIVPIGVPILMGLDYYGQFVSLTASAFLIQRLTDFPAETLIFEGDRKRLVLRSFLLQFIFFMFAIFISALTTYKIDLIFLLGLQCSSVAFSLVLSTRSDRLTFVYLTSFLAAYIAALAYALGSGKPLAVAISIPNYLALIWIPLAMMSPLPTAPLETEGSRPLMAPVLDIPVRVAAGSFVAFSTLGLASIATSGSASDTAQVRLLGTALGFSAFMLPWPLKSLVGVLRASNQRDALRLQRYLTSSRVLAALTIGLSLAGLHASRILLYAGLSLVFLNFLVVERWNIAQGRLGSLAKISLVSTVAAFAAFKLPQSALIDSLERSSFSILIGTALYAALSCRILPSKIPGQRVAAELALVSLACALVLFWSKR